MLDDGCGQDVGPALNALSARWSRLVKSKMIIDDCGDNCFVVDEFFMKGPVFASWCPWSGYWRSHFLCLLCSSKSS